MRRASLIAILVVVATLLSPELPRAHAADVTYTADFEPNGTTINNGDTITNQYPFVTFDAFDLGGWTVGTPGPGNTGVIASSSYNNPVVTAGNQHSGSYAGQLSCFSEFCSHGTYGLLNYTADSLSLYAGNTVGSSQIELDAYDSSKNFIGSDLVTPSTNGASTLLSVTSSASTPIAYFTVYQLGGGGIGASNYLYIDDLTISVPAGAAPRITVSAAQSSYEIGQGGEITIPLTLHRINGEAGAATVDVTGFANGVTGSASDPGTGNSSTLTIDASTGATLTSGVPLSVSATAADTQSAPATTITIQPVLAIQGIAAPSSESLYTCSTRKFTAEAQVAPGEPGSQVTFTTSSLSDASVHATSPATINNGLADSQVTITSTGGGKLTNAHLNVFATLSNGEFGVADVKITRSLPTITSVGPVAGKVAYTPRDQQAGSPIQIYGQGFCDTGTVDIGNQKASVPVTVQHKTGNNGPYDYVRVDVPRLATTGRVTMTTGAPAATSDPSSGSVTVDNYRNTDAWNFQNFPPQLQWDDMVQAFGDKQTYFQADPCGIATLGAAHCAVDVFPDPTALAWWAVSQAFESGACFGMTLATQRILEGIDSLPGNPPDIFDAPAPDVSDAAQGQHGVQPVLDLIKADHLMQLSTEFLSEFLGSQLGATFGFTNSNEVAAAITHILATGRFPMLQLTDGTGHLLVPYDIFETAPGAYDVYLYDVNVQYDGDEDTSQLVNGQLPDGGAHHDRMLASVLHLAADGSWTLASTEDGNNQPYHGGLADINVFDPSSIPAHPTLGSVSSGVNGIMASSGGAPQGDSSMKRSSAAITQVSSGGKTLFTSGGDLNTNHSTRLDAAPYHPIVGSSSSSGATMIDVGSKVHNLTVSTTGTKSGPASLTLVQGEYVGEVNASTTHGQDQSASFGSSAGTVGYTGTTNQPLDLQVVHSRTGGAETVGVNLASGGKSDKLALAKDGTVKLSHSGAATSYSLTLSGGGTKGLPGTFTTQPLHLGSGTVNISKIRWTALSGHTMKLRIGSRRVVVHNHTATLAKPKIKELTVHHHGRRHLIATLKANLPKLSSSSLIDVVWLLRRGQHVVYKHVVSLAAKGQDLHNSWRTKAKGRNLKVVATVMIVGVHGVAESTSVASKTKKV
jgi:hypothetical protein